MKVSYVSDFTFKADGNWTDTYSVGRKVRVVYGDDSKLIYHIIGSVYQESTNETFVRLGGNDTILSHSIENVELATVSNRSLPIHQDYPYRENYFWNVLQNSPYKSCVFNTFMTDDDPMIEKKLTNPRYDEFSRSYIFEERNQYLEINLIESDEYKVGISLAIICEKESDLDYYYDCGHGQVKIEIGEYYPQYFKNLKIRIEPKREDLLPIRLSSIGVLYGIYKQQTVDSIVEPDAELQIERKEIEGTGGFKSGTMITVPEYKVGRCQLTAYLDGQLLTPSLDYIELGENGMDSTNIQIVRDLDGEKLTFLVHKSKSLFDADAPLYYFPLWFDNLAENFYKLADRVTKLELKHLTKQDGTKLTPQGEKLAEGVRMAPVVVVNENAVAPRGSAVVLKREVFNDKKRESDG